MVSKSFFLSCLRRVSQTKNECLPCPFAAPCVGMGIVGTPDYSHTDANQPLCVLTGIVNVPEYSHTDAKAPICVGMRIVPLKSRMRPNAYVRTYPDSAGSDVPDRTFRRYLAKVAVIVRPRAQQHVRIRRQRNRPLGGEVAQYRHAGRQSPSKTIGTADVGIQPS